MSSRCPPRLPTSSKSTLPTPTSHVWSVADQVPSLVQNAIPEFKSSEISHLRRVVQFKFLPAHLQKQFYPPARLPRGDTDNPASPALLSASPVSLPASSPSSSPQSQAPTVGNHQPAAGDDDAENRDLVRYFLVCPTRYIQHADLLSLIRQHPPFNTRAAPPRIFYVTVPSLSPISSEQAEQWSEEYWPIAYKNTNPYGPHPSLVQRNTDEIKDQAGDWLALAKTAGNQISAQCLGEDIGVAIVDRSKDGFEVIAVAGDCRWRSASGTPEPHTGTGNVMAHAVQRAIAMVAKKRLRVGGGNPNYLDRSLFCDAPLTEVEKEYFAKDNIASSGYLCVDLDIYLTNEPCVMCSMAILHSRFKRCIFTERMPGTGGMTADGIGNLPSDGLKQGLFWRPSELNWKFLAWEFKEDEKEASKFADASPSLQV